MQADASLSVDVVPAIPVVVIAESRLHKQVIYW